jgi:Bacterial Ig domain
MNPKIIVTTSLLCGLLIASSASATPPLVTIDNPTSGKSTSGIITFYGWALGLDSPVQKVSAFVDDNQARTEIVANGPRGDVGLAFPNVPNSSHSGFAFALNTRFLPNGKHSISLEAVNANNETKITSVDFLISNGPGQENPTSVSVDLTGSQLRVVGQTEILVEGIKING